MKELEVSLKNAEANLVLYGTKIQGGVESFDLPPCLELALADVRHALNVLDADKRDTLKALKS